MNLEPQTKDRNLLDFDRPYKRSRPIKVSGGVLKLSLDHRFKSGMSLKASKVAPVLGTDHLFKSGKSVGGSYAGAARPKKSEVKETVKSPRSDGNASVTDAIQSEKPSMQDATDGLKPANSMPTVVPYSADVLRKLVPRPVVAVVHSCGCFASVDEHNKAKSGLSPNSYRVLHLGEACDEHVKNAAYVMDKEALKLHRARQTMFMCMIAGRMMKAGALSTIEDEEAQGNQLKEIVRKMLEPPKL